MIILLSPAHLKLPLSFFFLHFQPGCVNTTEVDIKKSSRMRNPHKTRKVNRCVSYGLAEVSVFNMSISKNPPQYHKHTSPWDSTLIIPFLAQCKQHLPLFIKPRWQTKVHPTRVCPGEPIKSFGLPYRTWLRIYLQEYKWPQKRLHWRVLHPVWMSAFPWLYRWTSLS